MSSGINLFSFILKQQNKVHGSYFAQLWKEFFPCSAVEHEFKTKFTTLKKVITSNHQQF